MLPALNIRQSHVSPTRRMDWGGVAAELLHTHDNRSYDFTFDGPALYLCFCLSGRRRDSVVSVDGEKATRLTEIANRFHVIPAGARFEGFSIPETPQRMVQVYLDQCPNALHPEIDLAEIAPRLAMTDAGLFATARKFEAALTAPQPLQRLYGETLGCAMAIELLRWQRGQAGAARPANGGLSVYQCNRVTEYMRERLADGVSLVQLANLVDLTPWHFCRAFRKSMGMPPHRWFSALRIERAKAMLADRGLNVTAIALALGFAGTPQFARAFRAATGMSPTAYRGQRI